MNNAAIHSQTDHFSEEKNSLLDQAIEATSQDNFTRTIMNEGIFAKAKELADFMVHSGVTVPDHLRKNYGDCFAIVLRAIAWGMDPWVVAEKTHIVNGRIGYEAQLINAIVCRSGAITGRFHYQYGGDWRVDNSPTAWVKVGAIIRGEREIQWGEEIYISKITVKNSPLWKTNPKQQAGYLAVKSWARAFTPSAIMGVYAVDELQDSYDFSETGLTPAIAESTEPEYYPDEKFEAAFPHWKQAMESGKKSADGIIAMVESKQPLTEDQKEKIRKAEKQIEESAE